MNAFSSVIYILQLQLSATSMNDLFKCFKTVILWQCATISKIRKRSL